MSHKTLFLQQSYIDCTNQYTALLEAPKLPLWDYVILTASNEENFTKNREIDMYLTFGGKIDLRRRRP